MVVILMYLNEARSYLMYVVNLISRFMVSTKDSHWKVGKRIMRYVVGTLGYGFWYTHTLDSTLKGYTNSDFGRSIVDRKRTSIYSFHLGTNMISWESQKKTHCRCVFCIRKICSSHNNILPCILDKDNFKGYGRH